MAGKEAEAEAILLIRPIGFYILERFS